MIRMFTLCAAICFFAGIAKADPQVSLDSSKWGMLLNLSAATKNAVYWCVSLDANPIRYRGLRLAYPEVEINQKCNYARESVEKYSAEYLR